MSREDDFSISELRRKRGESSHTGAAGGGQSGGQSGGYGGGHGGAFPPTNVGPMPLPQRRPSAPRAASASDEDEEQSEFHVDTWRMLAALKLRWKWLVAAAAVMGVLGFSVGYHKGKFSGSIKLIRLESAGGTDAFRAEVFSTATLAELLYSPELIRRVAAKAKPEIAPDRLAGLTKVVVVDKTELVRINILGQDVGALTDLLNLYGTEAVAFTRDMQVAETKRKDQHYVDILAKLDIEVNRVNAEMIEFMGDSKVADPTVETAAYLEQLKVILGQVTSKRIEIDTAELEIKFLQEKLAKYNPLTDQLASANARLVSLLAKFTEEHPEVKALRAEIAATRKQIAEGTNLNIVESFAPGSTANSLQAQIVSLEKSRITLARQIEELQKVREDLQNTTAGLSKKESRFASIKLELNSWVENQRRIAALHRDAQFYLANAQGYFKINSPVTPDDVDRKPRMKTAMSTGGKGAVAGLLIVAALVLLAELKERTMKTAAEVEHVTGLKVLGALGDLDKMTPEARERWAFRTWTIIAGQLSVSPSHGMVCGFTSSGHGEGRSTWIRLLGNAASRRGLRVLTVATKPSGTEEPDTEAETQAHEKSFTDAVQEAMNESGGGPAQDGGNAPEEGDSDGMATFSPSALAFPAEVTQKFNAGTLPAAHIPLPGWVWNLERRRQWQMALAHWKAIDNLVLLVELPPACVPESVLLAESLPQLVWLVDSGKASIRETKEQLEMMHHAKCQFVGAVLNHEPEPIIKL